VNPFQETLRLNQYHSQDSPVSTRVRLEAGWLRYHGLTPSTVRDIVISQMPRLAVGSIQIPIQWVLISFSQVVKQAENIANHSPSSTSKVQNMYRVTLPLPHVPSCHGA